jgi:transcriptional regulator with XRE-family HTH domain
MNATIGSILRAKRAKLKLTREQVAKRIKITPGYLGHLENDSHVRFSDELYKRLQKAIGVRIPTQLRAVHNKRASAWYRAYRKGL